MNARRYADRCSVWRQTWPDTGPLVAIVRKREKSRKRCVAAAEALRPPLLGVAVGVVDQQPFRRGGGVEFGIRRKQRQRRISCMDFQSCRKLHGIIATQSVLSGECCRLGDQPGRHLDDAVLAGEIELEIRHGGGSVLGRD